MKRLLRLDLVALVAAAAVFSVFPEIDIAAARLFYSDAGFAGSRSEVLRFVHFWLLPAAKFAFVAMMLYTIAAYLFRSRPWARNRRRVAYLALALALGPTLVVGVFKDQWGRARPGQIVEFGGTQRFTPALVPTDQCPENCSFPSGHPAVGFYLVSLAFAWPSRRRLWVAAALVSGGLLGLMRMAQGGHFLSDVVFSFFIVYFTLLILARIMRPDRSVGDASETKA